jgi:hypothetical protein
MIKKPLIETNPYLQKHDKYLKALVTNVASSTAVETGAGIETVVRDLTASKVHSKLLHPKGETLSPE